MISEQASNFSTQLVFLPPNSFYVALFFQSLYVTYKGGKLYYASYDKRNFFFYFFNATMKGLKVSLFKSDGQTNVRLGIRRCSSVQREEDLTTNLRVSML